MYPIPSEWREHKQPKSPQKREMSGEIIRLGFCTHAHTFHWSLNGYEMYTKYVCSYGNGRFQTKQYKQPKSNSNMNISVYCIESTESKEYQPNTNSQCVKETIPCERHEVDDVNVCVCICMYVFLCVRLCSLAIYYGLVSRW